MQQQPSSREQYAEPERRAELDLNHCSSEQLLQLGLDSESVDRVIENRPYRNKLELLSRIIVPEEVYITMKDSVVVHDATEPVKVA